jgi:2-oxoglutarate ferredoxin oxidoreductase subunit beta
MKVHTSDLVDKYFRKSKKFPIIWCGGCGNGTIVRSILRSIENLHIPQDDIAMVSGIGCSSRAPTYFDFKTLHTTHGRALAFATGLKLAAPNLKVIAPMGDGDALAIGGNHFIHTCRRNIDITAVIFNNFIYGMTGGQVSPTTPEGDWASTAQMGALEQPLDAADLAACAGATYVARTTTAHVWKMDQLITKAISHKGFSVVEVLTQCPTYYGRKNRMPKATDMLDYFKKNSIPVSKAANMEWKDIQGKIIIGELVNKGRKEYTELYAELQERAKKHG